MNTLSTIKNGILFVGILVGFALAGCGGGSGGGGGLGQSNPTASNGNTKGTITSAPVTSVAPAAPFSPNYRGDLATVRRWGKAVVTVGLTAPAADATGTIRNVQPFIQQAVALWNSRVGQYVNYQFTTAPNPDVKITFVQKGALDGGVIGRTEVFFDANQTLSSAEVKVDVTLADDYVQQVVTHELGHALGIQGHSLNGSDLMFATAHLPVVVTDSDANTILMTYAATRAALRSVVASGPLASAVTVCSLDEFAH